jgi:hypothetical protein
MNGLEETQHSPHQPLMMETETVSEMSGTNSTLTHPIVRDELIVSFR